MALAASLPLVAAPEGSQELARDSDRRPGARPSLPDRRTSGAFAQAGPITRQPSFGCLVIRIRMEPVVAGPSTARPGHGVLARTARD